MSTATLEAPAVGTPVVRRRRRKYGGLNAWLFALPALAVYAIGPMVSTYLTGDMTSGIVWSVVAGATANYVYYWHCRENIAAIKQHAWNDPIQQHAALKEEGGVQPYVIWVGVVFYLLFSLTMFKMLQDGALDGDKVPKNPAKTAGNAEDVRFSVGAVVAT